MALVETPQGTLTHRPIPHIEVVNALIKTLGFRHIGVIGDEYAVSHGGQKMFGVLDWEMTFAGCRFSIAIRNAHDKSMRLAMPDSIDNPVKSPESHDPSFSEPNAHTDLQEVKMRLLRAPPSQ